MNLSKTGASNLFQHPCFFPLNEEKRSCHLKCQSRIYSVSYQTFNLHALWPDDALSDELTISEIGKFKIPWNLSACRVGI